MNICCILREHNALICPHQQLFSLNVAENYMRFEVRAIHKISTKSSKRVFILYEMQKSWVLEAGLYEPE